jgi:phosphoribosylformylglycinamidine synthase
VQLNKVKALVLRAAGINCDQETMEAWRYVGIQVELKHINELTGAGASKKLAQYQILTVPGGFAYGDDLGAGKLMANDLLYRLKEAFMGFVDAGKPVLGICNGFQVLAKAGLFGDISLTNNANGKFECRWVNLKVSPESNCIFTKGIEKLYLPVAHGEGQVVVKDATTLAKLEAGNQVALRYIDEYGNPAEYPANPNGSIANIAGISNATGTVFGLMPHPERFISPLNHPRWTRIQGSEGEPLEGDGVKIFRNAAEYIQKA